jgi:tRNA A37 methylthiotransferase MiaB
MRENPLSLALVVVVFALAAMLYYTGKETLEQRTQMAKMIVEWQKEQQVILGGCVSSDVTKNMMDNMQRITDTMLSYNNKEIVRMQEAIDKERDRVGRLTNRQLLVDEPLVGRASSEIARAHARHEGGHLW